MLDKDTKYFINPTGRFCVGGPALGADRPGSSVERAGVTSSFPDRPPPDGPSLSLRAEILKAPAALAVYALRTSTHNE